MNTNGTITPLNNKAGLGDPLELRKREDDAFRRALDTMKNTALEDLLSLNWLRQFHREIFGDLYLHAGTFRSESIRVALHVPSAHTREEVERQMEQYIADCSRRVALALMRPEAVPALLGFAFWKFTYIAPFADGNGRVANGLSVLLQRHFNLPGVALYDRMQAGEYARFVEALRAYDAGNATPFFDYLNEKTGSSA